MNDINLCTPIIIDCNDPINQMTFDGCFYYCTVSCKNTIVKLNKCMETQETYCTLREYDCICYDYCEHCFWVSCKSCCNELFKLDCSMNEIDCISLCGTSFHGVITGLSYHCCKNTLLVTSACSLLEVDKISEKNTVLYSSPKDWIIGVLSICPGTILFTVKDHKQYLQILDECGKQIRCYSIADKYSLKNLIFNPCHEPCEVPKIDAFVLKRFCYPYLCRWAITDEILGFTPCYCNYKICHECCCEDKPCHTDPCSDIMESIALIEAALSHILNAEGEKLQKVLSTTDDIEKILCVNREVNKTIVSATHLEHVLHDKLSTIVDCCCPRPFCNEHECGHACCDVENTVGCHVESDTI